MSDKKVFVLVGEPSGDLHGANLLSALIQNRSLRFKFNFGVEIKWQMLYNPPEKHINDLAFMGFIEVLANIRTIFKNFTLCKQQILGI